MKISGEISLYEFGKVLVALAAIFVIYQVQMAALAAGINGVVLKTTIGVLGIGAGLSIRKFIPKWGK